VIWRIRKMLGSKCGTRHASSLLGGVLRQTQGMAHRPQRQFGRRATSAPRFVTCR